MCSLHADISMAEQDMTQPDITQKLQHILKNHDHKMQNAIKPILGKI